jgi:hypothetical protein
LDKIIDSMKKLIILLFFSLLLVSCQSAQSQQYFGLLDWKYGDLKLVDPSDTDQPEQDVVAAFTRITGPYFQMRLDFLDLGDTSHQDLYIPIDTNPGGLTQITTDKNNTLATDIAWDYLIKISSSGKVEILNSQQMPVLGMSLLIVRDREQDYLVLSFKRDALPLNLARTHFQVIVTPAYQNTIVDKSAVFSMDSPSPARAKVLFAFWNTFNPATPATTLRSWAGAHTGPGRSRHGMQYLLDSAAQTRTTLVIFSLTEPDTLSALDYIGAMPLIQNLASQGLLVLPTFMGGDVDNSLQYSYDYALSLRLARNFMIDSNTNEYFNTDSNKNNLNFMWLIDDLFFNNSMLNDFGDNDYAQYIKSSCPFLAQNDSVNNINSAYFNDCKRLFVNVALSQPSQPLILGGNFPDSILGDPFVGSELFNYINTHPWIQVVNENDLLPNHIYQPKGSPPYPTRASATSAITPLAQSTLTTPELQSSIRQALEQAPDNQVTGLAWQVYDYLVSSSSDKLQSLKANYLGQIGEMVSAANWVENPIFISSCAKDLDYDGIDECILANSNIFTIIEPEGGYIPFVFSRDQTGVHQIIGPSWEFLVGLGDPLVWDSAEGVRSDPDQILGAFPDSFNKWNLYSYSIKENKIDLVNDDMTMRKSFIILSNQLRVEIRNLSTSANTVYIPLVLDPWVRFIPNWGDLYSGVQAPFGYRWCIISDISVMINSTNPIDAFPFNATHAALLAPENPNFDYLPGHYLPYPMALVEIDPSEDFTLDISIGS